LIGTDVDGDGRVEQHDVVLRHVDVVGHLHVRHHGQKLHAVAALHGLMVVPEPDPDRDEQLCGRQEAEHNMLKEKHSISSRPGFISQGSPFPASSVFSFILLLISTAGEPLYLMDLTRMLTANCRSTVEMLCITSFNLTALPLVGGVTCR